MKDVKEILLYIFIVIASIFVIFAITEYGKHKKEFTTIIEQLQSAKNRIVNITEQFKQAGKIIDDLRNTAEQERISYKELEKYSSQLEETIRKQREIYSRLTESNQLDTAGIGKLERINQSNDNIVKGILAELSIGSN